MRLMLMAVVLVLAFGCAGQITGDGLQVSVGQSIATTCGPDANDQDNCSSATGGQLSETGASILAPIFGILGRIGSVLVGLPPATP